MTAVLELEARLDSGAADRLLAELKSHRGADLTVDATGVEMLGALAAQTLLVAARSWQEDGNAFACANLPEPAVMALTQLGLSPEDLNGKGAE